MPLLLALLGFIATIAQIVLMRELVAVFYGNELLYGLSLAAWMAWTATGAAWVRRWLASFRGDHIFFSFGLFLTGFFLLGEMAIIRLARVLLRVTPGVYVEFLAAAMVTVISLAPLCLLAGFLFTLGVQQMLALGGSSGAAYVWESFGALVGGIIFYFVCVYYLDPFQIGLLVSLFGLSALGMNWLVCRANDRLGKVIRRRRKVWLFFGLALMLTSLMVIALPVGKWLNEATLQWTWKDWVYAKDSLYGRLIIRKSDSQFIFYENGLLSFETQGIASEEVVHFPLLSHPEPKDILLIGGGVAGDLAEIFKHPVERVTYLELDPLLIESAKTYLPKEKARVLADPRLRLLINDGRLYLKQGHTGDYPHSAYDVIIVDLPEPANGALNRYYTLEFFQEARRALKPGGILSVKLPSAENYWSPEMRQRNASIYHTLKVVFADIVVIPGETDYYLALSESYVLSAGVLSHRLIERGIETRWVTPEYLAYIFDGDRYHRVRLALENSEEVRFNLDLVPICYYYDQTLWLSRFYPNIGKVFQRLSMLNLAWVALPLAVLLLLARQKRNLALTLVVAGTGFAGMVLELVGLFTFQAQYGFIFSKISLIVTAFMAGLVCGGAASNRWLDLSVTHQEEGKIKPVLIWLQLALAIYSLILLGLFQLHLPIAVVFFFLLVLVAGCLTGAIFPLAVRIAPGDADLAVGRLYGMDLLGGCLGALLGTALLIPLLGIPNTCLAAVMVGLAGALAVTG